MSCEWGGALHPLVLPVLTSAMVAIALLYYRAVSSRYRSVESYKSALEKTRQRNAPLVAKGYLREVSPGEFEFTTAYYSSAEYQASRSSSSSSSSGSSSSSLGGGSSGGGGSSSSW